METLKKKKKKNYAGAVYVSSERKLLIKLCRSDGLTVIMSVMDALTKKL